MNQTRKEGHRALNLRAWAKERRPSRQLSGYFWNKNVTDINKVVWSEWRQASSQSDAIRMGQKVWPEALVGQGPNRCNAWFAVDRGAKVRVIEIKSEDGLHWQVRTRQRENSE